MLSNGVRQDAERLMDCKRLLLLIFLLTTRLQRILKKASLNSQRSFVELILKVSSDGTLSAVRKYSNPEIVLVEAGRKESASCFLFLISRRSVGSHVPISGSVRLFSQP